MTNQVGFSAAPVTAQMFGSAALEHMKNYGKHPNVNHRFIKSIIIMEGIKYETFDLFAGTKPEHFAKIAYNKPWKKLSFLSTKFISKSTLV